MKHKALLLVWCGLVALLLSSCALLPEEESVRTAPMMRSYTRPEYQTAPVERGDLIHDIKVSCSYVPVQTVSLSFAQDGEYVDRYLVKTGDTVEKGQLLAQLQLGDLEPRIAALENEITVLELQIEYEEKYYALDQKRLQISTAQMDVRQKQEEMQKLQQQYERALQLLQDSLTYQQLSLDALKDELAQKQIRAPFSGTITRVKEYRDGEKSEFGVGVITLVDSTRSIFRAFTEHWNRFQPGEQYSISVKNVGYEANVITAEELGLKQEEREEGKRSYVYFTLAQPSFELKEGDSGTIAIVLDQRLDVLHVPAKSISEAAGQPIVYYLNEDGLKAYKTVETGVTIDLRTEIIAGVEEGESVIIK